MEQHKFDFDKFTTQAREQLQEVQTAAMAGNDPDGISAVFSLVNGAAYAIASIADSLQRIATAQETIAHLTNIDLDATIQEGSKILYAEMKSKEMRGETN